MGAAASKPVGAVASAGLDWSRQLEEVRYLARKHLTETWALEIINRDDFVLTSTDREISHDKHPRLVAALDALLTYQEDRGVIKDLKSPRMRIVELLKLWLRANAVNAKLPEDEVRRTGRFCRDILRPRRSELFPSMRKRSFMVVLSEVFDEIELQLREVLERERTCAELVEEVLKMGRNLVADATAYMLLAPTDLKQTDELGSVEVVDLWKSLEEKSMEKAWKTGCGSLVASLVCTPSARRLFDVSSSVERGAADAAGCGCRSPRPLCNRGCGRMAAVGMDWRGVPYKTCCRACALSPGERHDHDDDCASAQFGKGNFKNSGLAGPFREPSQRAQAARQCYLDVGKGLLDVTYLLGDVLTRFQEIGKMTGDYGMIRLAPWLHPCLEVMTRKVGTLSSQLQELRQAVDHQLVFPGVKVKVSGSDKQKGRAYECMRRAVGAVGAAGPDSHVCKVLKSLQELKDRSAPERLPHHVDSMATALVELQDCLRSDQFHRCVGSKVFRDMPPLLKMDAASREPWDNEPLGMSMLALAGHDV